MSRWWKCDLQVATPAWDFKHEPGMSHDLSSAEGKAAFAVEYMAAVKAKGLDVVALADHNTGEWIDVMVAAGKAAEIAVFPGCEITTGSGADGIHLLIVGDRFKTAQDFDRLLSGPIGYSEDAHPRFHMQGNARVPGSSGKTVEQILNELPESYLVIAPHVLNDNGLASLKTAKGDIRYKALHHPRLMAIDPGDCSNPDITTFKGRFQKRELDNIPRVKTLAFVSTSDAYSLADLGRRFCWIRMEQPTLEGLRQAFLDCESRVICDWDSRLESFPDRNPNNIRHGWISRIGLREIFEGTTSELDVALHPGLNVLIGGRGSGKSTLVAAARQLYSGYESLPSSIRVEAEAFAALAFARAVLSSEHKVAASQEVQRLSWKSADGLAIGGTDDAGVESSFAVRVVNQKELYARVVADPNDPGASSRSLLAFVDESLGLRYDEKALPGTWSRARQDAATAWTGAARTHERLRVDVEQLPSVRTAIATLQKQINSFDSDEARARRESFERIGREEALIAQERESLTALISRISELAEAPSGAADEEEDEASMPAIIVELIAISTRVRAEISSVAESARGAVEAFDDNLANSEWRRLASAARTDRDLYLAELTGQGLRPEAYVELRNRLDDAQRREEVLTGHDEELRSASQVAEAAWTNLIQVIQQRRDKRALLFDKVALQSGRLQFVVKEFADKSGWVNAVRALLNLRADGFIDDVLELSEWLFESGHQLKRIRIWRDGLIRGDLSGLASKANASLRAAFQKRLEGLDEAVRLRLATEIADDLIEMSFLRDGGDIADRSHWRPITRGSPGQRTAAMLAFVLHHGDEPLILDQPEDDLDTEWLTGLVIRELRASRWRRQLVVVSHNANVPVNGDADRVIVLENYEGALRVRSTELPNGSRLSHCGAIEVEQVRDDIQKIMEGGVRAFQQRELRYNLDEPSF